MRTMKAVAPLMALLINGCFLFGTGRASSVGDAPPELKDYKPHVPDVSDRWPYGFEGLKPGQWARYVVRRDGVESSLRLGVIKADGARLWIEVVDEGDVRAASARLVAPDGVVEKAFFRESGPQGTSAVIEQKIVQRAETPDPAPAEETSEAGELDIAGARRRVTLTKSIFRDEALGRTETDEAAWCADLPGLYAASPAGGLARLKSDRRKLAVDLAETGTDYKPLVELK